MNRTVALAVTLGAALSLSASATAQTASDPRLFETSDVCLGCHNGVVSSSGRDVSIGSAWRASMMANAARDPYWQAAVRREALMHPEHAAAIQDECSTCHMPMARYQARATGDRGLVFAHLPVAVPGAPGVPLMDALAADGVSCTTCHQIRDEKLGTEESFVGGFVVDTSSAWGSREIFGPFAVDSGRTRLMHSASGFTPAKTEHLQRSEVCATCHTLYTTALGPGGEVVGELPEQVPYLEWQHSDYPGERSCQSCHMPVAEDSVPVTGVLGKPRVDVNLHTFRGGNFFMLRLLNRYAGELGVTALPHELSEAARQTVDHLQTRSAELRVARAEVAGGRLHAEIEVTNLAGHKLPTAYPSRRAWLHVTVTDRNGSPVFESGAFEERGRIRGNDNDADPHRYEPHYRTVRATDEVPIYEAIMVDLGDRVTTGLLEAVRFVKDNRLLPRGFDRETAEEDIAVRGEAAADPDFTGGGDRVRYEVDVAAAPGPFRVHAELWYQPIAYRWAQNLREQPAPETDRFVRQYESMASTSAVILARAAATATDAAGSQ